MVLGFTVPVPNFPWLGNTLPVAILFLLHVAVAEYSVGAITLAAAMELRSVRGNSVFARRYAQSLGVSYYLVFSIGATFAVFAVVLLGGLWGRAIGELVNVLLPLIGVAFGLFFLITPLLVWYRVSFASMSPLAHGILGMVLAALQTVFVVLIVGLDAYLITPGNGGLLGAALNPPYLPLLIHRLIGNVSWTALFLAGFAAVKSRRAIADEERAFQAWAARINLRIGLWTAAAMPVAGFALVEVLRSSQPGYFDNLVGSGGALMVVQEVLVGIVLVGGNLALGAESGRLRGNVLALAAAGICLAGMIVAALPAAVIPDGVLFIRYAGLGAAVLVTVIHLLLPRRRPLATTVAPLRRSLVTVGLAALVTALFMGYIKEHARGDYAIYGELHQGDAHANFTPPGSLYP